MDNPMTMDVQKSLKSWLFNEDGDLGRISNGYQFIRGYFVNNQRSAEAHCINAFFCFFLFFVLQILTWEIKILVMPVITTS